MQSASFNAVTTAREPSWASSLASWQPFPDANIFHLPNFSAPYPEWPFEHGTDFLVHTFHPWTMHVSTPLLFALTYFTSVHLLNGVVRKRQLRKWKQMAEKSPKSPNPGQIPKRLPAAPTWISTTAPFRLFVLCHNIFLCAYSVATFYGMVHTMRVSAREILPDLFGHYFASTAEFQPAQLFWQSVCNLENGIWNNYGPSARGLAFWGYLFYLSKFYEVLDTAIILLKGRQASLLQSYHHSGAILCMWAGVRFQSAPIWIFVVFNSFIHSIMYFYFTLSCLHIRVPMLFKQVLTSLQIVQFVVGGSLGVVHLFVSYKDVIRGTTQSCIETGEEALALYVNVLYLTPLTMLFGAFYIDSYRKKKQE